MRAKVVLIGLLALCVSNFVVSAQEGPKEQLKVEKDIKKLGQRVDLKPDLSVIVTREDPAKWQSRHPNVISKGVLPVVCHLAFSGGGILTFGTDYDNAAKSDIYLTCKSKQFNVEFGEDESGKFDRPGVFRGYDGRMYAMATTPYEMTIFFAIPADCTGQSLQLVVAVAKEGKQGQSGEAVIIDLGTPTAIKP